MTDKIFLNQMNFYGYHGALPEEKKLGQPFIVDVVIGLDLYAAGKEDALTMTINYAEVYDRVRTIVTGAACDLIEAVAQRIADRILADYPLAESCKVKVSKPRPPIDGNYSSVAVAIERKRSSVYLGLGSNIGDRALFLRQALERLSQCEGIRAAECSSIYETEPYGPVSQNKFLNMAVRLDTLLPPAALLNVLQQIEQDLRRKREIHWGPRTIDLDILVYGREVISTEKIALPHPEISRRAFVLKPMAEIAPHLVVPGINQSIIELWQMVEEKEGVHLWRKNNGEGEFGLFAN
ncbi:MAG: 2-amino-4-hydroxy-6-hydroxymethyldihydropteridine diphosphokinase [Sporolactobacillus sp.]